MANKIVTVSELAEHLNVHRITIYRLLKSGTLPGFKIGRVWRFDLDEISDWMASGKSTAALADEGSLDGKLDGDGDRSCDGNVSRDSHPKVERTQKRSQLVRPSKDLRGGKTSRS